MRRYWTFGVTGFVLLLDQSTKWLVKNNMEMFQSIPVIGSDFFRLTYIENDGIAFGIPFGGRVFLTIFTVAAALFLIYYIFRLRNSSVVPKLGLAMILGGALGNLTDRFFRGQVIDFFDFDFPDFIMERWPVFNIADSSVTIGVTLLLIYFIFFESGGKSPSMETENDIHSGRDGPESGVEPGENSH